MMASQKCNARSVTPSPRGRKRTGTKPRGARLSTTRRSRTPALVASPAFSWKVTDGDSPLPNKKGKRPCDQTGYAGHWVIWFSQGWLPKRVNADGTVELPEGAIQPATTSKCSAAWRATSSSRTERLVYTSTLSPWHWWAKVADRNGRGYDQSWLRRHTIARWRKALTAAAPQFATPAGATTAG